MPDVVRFALDTERELYVPGLGRFNQGILDIPAGNAALLARARYLLTAYRAVELGTVDETTPYPDLPAVGPGAELADPYPQYLTDPEAKTVYASRGGAPLDAKVEFGLVGNGVADDTVGLKAAFAASAGRHVIIPPGTYRFTDTITISNGARISGFSEADTVGTVLRFDQLDGRPAFTNNSDGGLSFAAIEHLQIISSNTVGTAGNGDCFKLYGVTNNSRFGSLSVRNFRGHGFNIAKKTNSSDPTACGNVVFDQIFVISCGGYAWKVDGYVNATWNMPDVNSCMAGAFYFLNGVSNQAQVTITGLWWEGSRTWSSLQPILLENMGSQVVNLIGCNFQGYTSSTEVVRITVSAAMVTLIGCTGYGFTNWINDVFASSTIPSAPRINYAPAYLATGVTAQGPAAFIDHFNTTGSTNQRRYRWSFSGNLYVLSERNDAGASVRDILYVIGASGEVAIVGATSASSAVPQ
jgi:hypothetical protein